MTKKTKKHNKTVVDEEADGLNQTTRNAGLLFDVHKMKNYLRQYCEEQDLKVEVHITEKDDDGNRRKTNKTERKIPQFTGAAVALTACLQRLCRVIIENVIKFSPGLDKTDMKIINRPMVAQSLAAHPGLKEFYFNWQHDYNKNARYTLAFGEKGLDKLMKRVDTTVSFSPKATSFLTYLLDKATYTLIRTAFKLIKYAKAKSMNNSAIEFAIEIEFNEEWIGTALSAEAMRAAIAVKKADKEKREAAEIKKEKEKKKDKKKGKKSTKRGKSKKKKDVESNSESDSESDSESSDEEVVSDSESDEEDTKKSTRKSRSKSD